MGVDFGDLNGDGSLDIYVSNIAAELRPGGEPLRVGQHRRPAPHARGRRAVRRTAARRSGCRAAAGAGTPGSPTSTTTACSRRCRRRLHARRRRTAGPSCTSWRWATTATCAHPRPGRASSRATTCSGHLHNPFFVRAGTAATTTSPREVGLGRQPRSAAASPRPTWTATATSTSRSRTSGSARTSTATTARAPARSSASTCCCLAGVRLARSERGTPARDTPAVRRSARPPTVHAAGRPAAGRARSTAATATRASAARSSTSASGGRRPPARGSRSTCAGATRRARCAHGTLELTPGWHTVRARRPERSGIGSRTVQDRRVPRETARSP